MDFKEIVVQAISKITKEKVQNLQLEVPEIDEFGDYSTNVAMTTFGNARGGNARDYAGEIVKSLESDNKLMRIIEKVEVAGSGFINFWLKKDILIDNLIQIVSEKDGYGKNDLGKGKKVMVEFAHPNTHKAFHIGHLRNITTGESIVRLLEFSGYKVIRANYQGDVGLHIAKALWGIKKVGFTDPEDINKRAEYLGKAYAVGSASYEESSEAKSEIQEINKKIYSKTDPDINELYLKTRQWSLDYFDSIYKRVYSRFDRLYFESECYESGKKYALEGFEKGILKKSDGAIIFPGSEYGLHDRVFITGEDVPTYEAKDLGLINLQMQEFSPNRVVHIVGPEQRDYFNVVFKAQELLFPETKGKQLHVPYGWVRLKEGKMSSRTGQVVLGETLLDEAKESILKQYGSDDDVAEEIAVGAVKYSFLRVSREQDIAFDLKESVSLEGDSGPYIQYAYARTQSLLAKAEPHYKPPTSDFASKIEHLHLSKEELSLLRTFIRFSAVITDAGKIYSPNKIASYLHGLGQKFNAFYNKHDILEQRTKDKMQSEFRLILTMATGQLLQIGLYLLGIRAPKKM